LSASASDPDALRKIVEGRGPQCARGVSDVLPGVWPPGRPDGHYAVLKDLLGATQCLVIPTDTHRLSGWHIDSPSTSPTSRPLRGRATKA